MTDKQNTSFKICSCGEVYSTEEIFVLKTKLIGSLHTLNFMDTDLELRNCLKCGTTLTRQIIKMVRPRHKVAS